ncbi:MAG: hypothetical protein O7H39_02225 [Gammaproteobacteria bacterium]|nr:hypothetical protein [Gammaproteobacteria bacterium]
MNINATTKARSVAATTRRLLVMSLFMAVVGCTGTIEVVDGLDSVDTYENGELVKSCDIYEPSDCWVRTWTGRWARPGAATICDEIKHYWAHRTVAQIINTTANANVQG